MENMHGLFAVSLDGKGGSKALDWAQVAQGKMPRTSYWIHLQHEDPATRQWLSECSELDELVIEALLAENTRPRVLELDEGAVVFLRGVNLNEHAEPEDMVSIRLYIDKHRIISVRRRKLKAVQDMEERLSQGRGPKNTGEWLSMLVSSLCERMEPTLSFLNEQTDTLEERVMEETHLALRQGLVDIRKQAILFRRYLAPQRDALSRLKVTDYSWLSMQDRRNLQEGSDRLTRYVEDLDAVRERTQIVQDELQAAISDRLNHNLYVLSVVAAIFLPLGFLTGLLGVNVAGIPGAEDDNAFWIFNAALIGLVIVQVIIFKRLKWI